MKKILALLIVLTTLLTLVSCDDGYPAVKSSAVEKQVVMTLDFDGQKYDIKYELYRALFLTLKGSVDGGDASVWTGEDKEKYVNLIDGIVKSRISEIYSVFYIAKKIGIDVYSSEYDKYVKDFIKVSVEGGYAGTTEVTGFDGDYDKYLEHLKNSFLNYSVQDLIIRYSLATEEIFRYYAGNIDSEEFVENVENGHLEYTRDDVLAFYNSGDCVRVIRAFLPKKYFTKERAEQIQKTILEKADIGEDAVSAYIISNTTTGASDVKNGEIIAKHNLDRQYYAELIDTAFALETFGVSDVIDITTGGDDGYVIIYRTVKGSEHFEACYDQIKGVYVQNEVGKIIDTAAASISENLKNTDILNNIDRSTITMD